MRFLTVTLLLLLGFGAEGQILKKLKSATKALDNPTGFAKQQGVSLLKKSKAKMDSASFGFAISFADNAGLFENKETLQDVQDGILMLFNDDESDEDVANEYKDAGEMAFAANEYRLAEVSFYASALVFETQGMTNHVNYFGVIADLGLLNHTMGRYGMAETFTEQALEMRKDQLGEESLAYIASLNNKGVLLKDQGKYNEAESTLGEARRRAEEQGYEKELLFAILLNNEAMLFQQLGRLDEAEAQMKRCIALSEKVQGKSSSNHQRLLTNLAVLYQEEQKYEEAEALFLSVIEMKEKRLGKKHPDYAHMLNNLASLYVLMGKDEKVEELLMDAREIYIKKFGTNHPSVATNAANLGNFFKYLNRLDEAEPLLIEALDTRMKTLGKNHPLVAQSQEDLALLYWDKEDWSKSDEYFQKSLNQSMEFVKGFFPAMSETEKARYWDKLQPRFFKYFAFATEAPTEEVSRQLLNYRLSTKSILLNATQKIKKQILESGDEALIKAYEDWVDTKESLAAYYTLSREEIASQKINIDSLERSANSKEKYLSENAEMFNEGFVQSESFEGIQNLLEPGEAFVEILQIPIYERSFTGVFDYYALVVKKTGDAPAIIRIGDSRELDDKYFKYYNNAIRLKLKDAYSYDKFWAPIAPELTGISRVYMSKDGIYNQINVNTLTNGTFVFDQLDIELLTSGNDLKTVKERQNETFETPASLFGFPDYGGGTIASLPGTKKEVESINSILTGKGVKTQLYMGKDATEGAVKSEQPHAVYHFATHGFFLEDVSALPKERVFGIQPEIAQEQPMLRAGILFAGAGETYEGLDKKEFSENDNGVLTAYEAMNLSFDDTELVVLSACETGLGDAKAGEGVYGLQRAFLVAGANRIIMSLWKVDDTATQMLMTSFYKNLANSNDIRSSFKQAQKSLKQTHPEPYFWGAFVLIER